MDIARQAKVRRVKDLVYPRVWFFFFFAMSFSTNSRLSLEMEDSKSVMKFQCRC